MIRRYSGNLAIDVAWDEDARLHVQSSRTGCYRAKIYCLDANDPDRVEDAFLVTPPRGLVEEFGVDSEETLESIASTCVEMALVESITLVVERDIEGVPMLHKICPEYRVTNGVRDPEPELASPDVPNDQKRVRVSRRAGVAR